MINSDNIQIRETNANDFDNIMIVEKQAFGYDKEAKLVAEVYYKGLALKSTFIC